MDPSFRNWGISCMTLSPDSGLTLNHVAVIKTSLDKTSKDRKSVQDINSAKTLINGVQAYLKSADVIVVEMPTGSQSASAMKSFGVCVGIVGYITSLGIPIIYKTPQDVKKVVGNKQASKEEVIHWVSTRHPNILSKYKGTAEHQADATAVIYSALNQLKEIQNHGITNYRNP